MPKRSDIKKILLIGSGPITIGQACEFDYSGTQALRALQSEGYSVILLNSNPATIMTDPELADRVYLEPLTLEYARRVIERERPDSLLPTMGGQTALNLSLQLHRAGVLKEFGVEFLGASPEAIFQAEDRASFKAAMDAIGVETARSFVARSIEDGRKIFQEMGLPLILRPSFTLGGEGGGIARSEVEFFQKLERALFLSPSHDVLIEESLLGWKEYELEVVRDSRDNVIIVCSIENFDPMGVHTGDSITVAPAQTLSDRDYQNLRNQAIRIIRKIGVETGGSNIQFAVHPKNGRSMVIEMNPRVSRSSALASKATGFPIARVAALLAVGYTLDELTNPITGTTPCSFEPSLDYVVTKIPRFDFEKFRPTEPILGTQMKSVGEVMALGSTFQESLGKAIAGLETEFSSLASSFSFRHAQPAQGIQGVDAHDRPAEVHWDWIERPHPKRLWAILDALHLKAQLGASLEPFVDELAQRSHIDPWFLSQLASCISISQAVFRALWPVSPEGLWTLKRLGWTDPAIAQMFGRTGEEVSALRASFGILSDFCAVDTCAGEFEAKTPYFYSTYLSDLAGKLRDSGSVSGPSTAGYPVGNPKTESSAVSSPRTRVMILGGGPNRIGQGIEFDYCCVHAAFALKAMGMETLMVNCNPETVSTDFDISDRLYFEPLTPEHVLAIAHREKPMGVIVQLGGQTPLKIARALEKGGLKILGTSVESIQLAEDRKQCWECVQDLEVLGLKQPQAVTAYSHAEILKHAELLGYPLLLRPSYVLGGRGMRIIHSRDALEKWIFESSQTENTSQNAPIHQEAPLLMDRFLNRATEVDVDAISDGKETWIAGLMEHIEEAGIHSGDSTCTLPAVTLPQKISERLRTYTRELAKKMKVVGLMNVQFAIQGDRIYLLEVNPRASRTIPFVSKAIGKPLAQWATRIMLGQSLAELGVSQDLDLHLKTFSVKVPVFPFAKFPGSDVLLGPEMKSTGEVMGRGQSFASAYAKALAATGVELPLQGEVFLSIRDEDKAEVLSIARELRILGFSLCATAGTARFLNEYHLDVASIHKVSEGSPHCVEAIAGRRFVWVINTVSDEMAIRDSFSIRRVALENRILYHTVISAARAIVQAMYELKKGPLEIDAL